ncbi:MAG: baseplate J/gp47 family protein [Bacteroidales bacterium]|nr:baseplate J/gp47 family protein [Bacteroidales bacterium]
MHEFIEKDAEKIITDVVSLIEQKYGQKISEVSPERVLSDVIAYREHNIRIDMELLMQQNFVQTTTGVALNQWGELFGYTRSTGESDEQFRGRIIKTYAIVVNGTKQSYESNIKAIPEVLDAKLISKRDDKTLPPGVLQLTILEKYENNGILAGVIAKPETELKVKQSLLDPTFGIIGDDITYKAARPVYINGAISILSQLGYNNTDLLKNVNFQLDVYFGELSQSFSKTFGVYDLETELLKAGGVSSVTDLSFTNIPTLKPGEFYKKGAITITTH